MTTVLWCRCCFVLDGVYFQKGEKKNVDKWKEMDARTQSPSTSRTHELYASKLEDLFFQRIAHCIVYELTRMMEKSWNKKCEEKNRKKKLEWGNMYRQRRQRWKREKEWNWIHSLMRSHVRVTRYWLRTIIIPRDCYSKIQKKKKKKEKRKEQANVSW